MSATTSVQEYVAHQDKYARKRKLIQKFLIRGLGFKVLWHVNITGLENIPDSGPSILMMNHISMLDPALCMGAITKRYVIPMAKRELAGNPVMRYLIHAWGSYYVNRGAADRQALMNSIELVKSGQLILIAPEGTRQPQGLVRPKGGLAYVATKADAIIIPAAISGAVDWQKNYFRLRRPHVRLNFGPPFRFKTAGRKRIPRDELAAMTDEAMYQLSMAVVDETRRGVYHDLSQATTEFLEFISPGI